MTHAILIIIRIWFSFYVLSHFPEVSDMKEKSFSIFEYIFHAKDPRSLIFVIQNVCTLFVMVASKILFENYFLRQQLLILHLSVILTSGSMFLSHNIKLNYRSLYVSQRSMVTS